MAVFLYLFLGIAALSFWWVKKRFSYFIDRGFESAPTSFPFGSLKGVCTKVTASEGIDVYYKQYKGKAPLVGLFFFFQPTIMPLDLELIKNVLVRDFASFHDRGFYYNKEDEPTSAK